MNKQELIHLHGLLHEVAEYYRSTDDGTPDLRRYRSLGTHPTSIYHAKPAHERAAFALARALAREMHAGAEVAHSAADDRNRDDGTGADRPLERSSV